MPGRQHKNMFEITDTPIDINMLLRQASTEEDGGVVLFLGIVRRRSHEKRVMWLEYQAYPEMAVRSFQTIAEEVRKRWGVQNLSIIHRVGRLAVGDIAVAIVAASPHRREAFEACRYAIDRVKEIAPIWKKELTEEGCVWVADACGPALEVAHA